MTALTDTTAIALPTWRAAGDRGPRSVNADAVASHADRGGAVAFAVADGIGDTAAAARAARVAAAAAVRADTTDPVQAVLAAQRALRADSADGDCVLVVAVPAPGGGYRLGWLGDSRAYAMSGGTVRQLTTDHTIAEYFRARGTAVHPRMRHVVTTSVRTARPAEIGVTEVRGAEFLVLVTDGVHGAVDRPVMAQVLRYAPDPAAWLVAAATRAGTRDNATALVVHCGTAVAATCPATEALPVRGELDLAAAA